MNKEKIKKKLENALEDLREGYVIVEGIKDVSSLQKIGIESHNYSKKTIREAKGKVFILTDMDKEGERIAKEIEEKLRENTKVGKIITTARKRIAGILNLRKFEEIEKKYRKFLEVYENG